MDILVKDDRDRWYVFDVKHTRDDSYWRKTVGQLTFYDLAVLAQEGTGTRVTALLQPLCKEQIKPFRVSDTDRSQMQQRVAGFARDIWVGDRTPRQDTKECTWCDVRHACSRFTPVVGSDGKRRVAF